MKKNLVICGMIILSLFAVGCGKTIELTDEENHLIAEYAAELLIKYDRNMNPKYYSDEDATALTTEQVIESEDEAATESDAVQESTEDADKTETAEEPVETAGKSFDIAEFAGEKNISVKYSHYLISERYPSYDEDGMYIEIEAPKGYKLLVLKFDVANLTLDEQYVDLYSHNLEYSIIINDNKSAKQMLTILMDDLYTYQDTLNSGERCEAVLLFQIADSVAENIDSLKLRVDCGEEQRLVEIQ